MTETEASTQKTQTTTDKDGREWPVLTMRHEQLAWEHASWRKPVEEDMNTLLIHMQNWLGAQLAKHEEDATYTEFLTWPEPKYGPYITEAQRQRDDHDGDFKTLEDGSHLVKLKHPLGSIEEIELRPPNAAERELSAIHLDNLVQRNLNAVSKLSKVNLTISQLLQLRVGDGWLAAFAFNSFR